MIKSDKGLIIGLATLVIIGISVCVVCVPILINKQNQIQNYEELFFDIEDFEVDFDDDKDRYDIFANETHYYIPRKQLKIVIDTQYTYIELFINEYDVLYNKAYLHINIKNIQGE